MASDEAREKILIIEDEKDLVRLIRYNLEKERFRVLAASDGRIGAWCWRVRPSPI